MLLAPGCDDAEVGGVHVSDGVEHHVDEDAGDVEGEDDDSSSYGAPDAHEGADAFMDDIDPQALATDPSLRWILYGALSNARLLSFNPANQSTSLLQNHASLIGDTGVSVAGDKLLWQRADGWITVWSLNAAGSHTWSTDIAPPGAGWKARGITLDQDAQCPHPVGAQATYTVLWEGPPPGGGNALWPKPVLFHLDGEGNKVSEELLPDRYPNATLRDFRYTADGEALLAYRAPFSDGKITWYQRSGNAWQRLRTDSYTGASGMTGCVVHQVGIQCPGSYVDEAPGAGHVLASVLTTAMAPPSIGVPATYQLWTKSDGTAKILRSSAGLLLGPATPIVSNLGPGAAASSFAGKQPALCPIEGG